MPSVSAIYTAAVKSLALCPRSTVHVGRSGIAGDRRFHLIDGAGRLLTQRQRPRLAVVKAEYDCSSEQLTLAFPDEKVSGTMELGDAVTTSLWGRSVPGKVIIGPWNDALSRYCGGPVRLVKTDSEGVSYDEFPVSLLSQASIDLLTRITQGTKEDFEAKRFRPNFLIDGCSPHEEDTWLGGIIAVGPELRLRVLALDPRCAITTVDPDTGQRDFDVPRLLLTYRPSRRAPYFGVYATVESPGPVTVGDGVEFVSSHARG